MWSRRRTMWLRPQVMMWSHLRRTKSSPPVDDVVAPTSDEVAPPSDEVVAPPSDEVAPPSDDVIDPPSDDVLPPAADDVTPPPDDAVSHRRRHVPAECPPELLQQANQNTLSQIRDTDYASESDDAGGAQPAGLTQQRLSTGARINTAQDDPAGLGDKADDNCAADDQALLPANDCPPESLSQANDSQQALQLLRGDTDPAAESQDTVKPPTDEPTQQRLSTGLRVNRAQDDAAGLSVGQDQTDDECDPADQTLQTPTRRSTRPTRNCKPSCNSSADEARRRQADEFRPSASSPFSDARGAPT